jgi:hypothetical protein
MIVKFDKFIKEDDIFLELDARFGIIPSLTLTAL